MKTTALILSIITVLSTTSAMAQAGCSINDDKGNGIEEMRQDPSANPGEAAKGSIFLKEEFNGYTVRAHFSGAHSELAVISISNGEEELSAAGIQLALKKAGQLLVNVTCD